MVLAIVKVIGNSLLATSLRDTEIGTKMALASGWPLTQLLQLFPARILRLAVMFPVLENLKSKIENQSQKPQTDYPAALTPPLTVHGIQCQADDLGHSKRQLK